ncbi:hypothetical protein [Phyllobacterium sp. 22552]|uniref:hypothetical protein n=1 Tax=Phyllobacterium sp. 22552 TaxID=3453941 RepID=UPI003F875362
MSKINWKEVFADIIGYRDHRKLYFYDELFKFQNWAIPIGFSVLMVVVFYVFEPPEWFILTSLFVSAWLWHSLVQGKLFTTSHLPIESDEDEGSGETGESTGLGNATGNGKTPARKHQLPWQL